MQFIKNEWMKLWSQKNAWIMLIFLCLIIAGIGSITKYYEEPQSTTEQRKALNEKDLQFYQSLLDEEDGFEEEQRLEFEETTTLIKYRIDNDLPGVASMSFDEFLNQSLSIVTVITSIFMVVIAAGTVANEFSTGTIKMLLTRPAARWKILLSKLVTTYLYGATLFIASLLFSALVAAVFWGTDLSVTLQLVNGQVVESQSMSDFWNTIPYTIGSLIMSTLFAFMIGSVFNSSTLAVGISLLLTLMGSMIVMFLAQYDFAKYIWLANDFAFYVPGRSPMIADLTFSFSLIVNIVYAIIFIAITFTYFMRRDVTA